MQSWTVKVYLLIRQDFTIILVGDMMGKKLFKSTLMENIYHISEQISYYSPIISWKSKLFLLSKNCT